MAQHHGIQGAYTALITPFTAQGEVDWAGLEQLVAYQIEQGIDGLLGCGTTGESPTLTWDEHAKIIQTVVQQGKGVVHVMAGVGSNNTASAIHRAQHAKDVGADSGLVVDCYYNGPSSSELRTEYYGAIIKAVPELPLMAYVIPGRTGCALAPEDVAILAAETDSLVGVKEATGDLDRMAHTRSLVGGKLSIMSGDDPLTLAMIEREDLHAQGVISVMSNLFPGAISEMVRHAHAGDMNWASKLEKKLSPVFGLVGITVETERRLPNGDIVTIQDKYRNPLPIKAMMAGLGLPAGRGRQPLGRMHVQGVQKARQALQQIQMEAPELLQPIASFFGVDIAARLKTEAVWESLAVEPV